MAEQPALGLDRPPLVIDELIAEARREADIRRRVFPRWVESGKITAEVAEHRIACMELIEATLVRVKHAGVPGEG